MGISVSHIFAKFIYFLVTILSAKAQYKERCVKCQLAKCYHKEFVLHIYVCRKHNYSAHDGYHVIMKKYNWNTKCKIEYV